MKASELIAKLKTLIEEHGDLEVGIYNDEFSFYGRLLSTEVDLKSVADKDPGHDFWSYDDENLGAEFIGIG